MATNKTTKTKADVNAFIKSVPNEKRQTDALQLVEIMKELTGEKPYMYGPSIIGFGNYHYKYESGREGDAPLAGFSPRKDSLVLYFNPEFPGREEFLKALGKHKAMVSCVYVKKLEDISIPVLKKMVRACIAHTKKNSGNIRC